MLAYTAPRRVTRECTRLRRGVCAAAPTITGGRGRFVRWMGVNHSFPHRPGQRRVREPHEKDGGGHAGRNDPAGRGGHGRPPAPEDTRNRARQVRVVPRTTCHAPVDDDSAGERGFRGGVACRPAAATHRTHCAMMCSADGTTSSTLCVERHAARPASTADGRPHRPPHPHQLRSMEQQQHPAGRRTPAATEGSMHDARCPASPPASGQAAAVDRRLRHASRR